MNLGDENMTSNQIEGSLLPIKRKLNIEFASSLAIVILMTIASVAGLLFQSTIYPNEELTQAFVPNEVINLIIGAPILLGSLGLTKRGHLVGLLFWPGALFYVFYTYIVYVLSMPLSWIFFMYLTLLMLSTYTLIGVVAAIDSRAVQQRLVGSVPEKIGGVILFGFGVLFLLRVVGLTVGALVDQSLIPPTELALNIVDFLIAPALIIGGLLLLKRASLGYVLGLGLLFQVSMLFVGLIFILILEPIMVGTEFELIDVLVVFVMGLISFIPLVLFVRGAAPRRQPLLPSTEG
jgi:hypothetical protein